MSRTSTLGHTSKKCVSWVLEATIQVSENAAKTRMSEDSDYRMIRGIATSAARGDNTIGCGLESGDGVSDR